MKLPDFLEHGGLNGLRREMGANRLGDLTLVADPNRLTEDELYMLTHGGIDLKSLDDLRRLPDGTLALKDSRVLLYIRDVSIYQNGAYGGVKKLPKYHLASCATLRQMQSEGRFSKYVVAARQDGYFEVNIIEGNQAVRSSAEPLNVCQNCLDHISFNDFSMTQSQAERHRRVAAFVLTDFFKQYPRALVSQKSNDRSDSAPLNVYPEDFEALSAKVRNERGWRCEKCSLVLSDPALRKYLHVHHKNGQKFDSRPENLELLCLWCHAKEPHHAHMRVLAEYAEFERIRSRMLQRDNETDSARRTRSETEPASVDPFVRFAIEHRLPYHDFRDRRGALWISVPPGHQLIIRQLEQWGFNYKNGRGWWHK